MRTVFDENQRAELASWKAWMAVNRLREFAKASEDIPFSPDEEEEIWLSFCRENRIDPSQPGAVPPDFGGLPPAKMRHVALRDARIQKWKDATFGPDAAEHFARRRQSLDRIVYSMIRVDSAGLARELGFRILEGEESFAEISRRYSAGEEKHGGGVVGPVAMGNIHPALAETLRTARPGDLLGPFQVADWFVLAKVEAHLPAELDGAMRRRMIDELAVLWAEKKCHGQG